MYLFKIIKVQIEQVEMSRDEYLRVGRCWCVIRDAAFGVVVFLSEPDPEFIQMSHVI